MKIMEAEMNKISRNLRSQPWTYMSRDPWYWNCRKSALKARKLLEVRAKEGEYPVCQQYVLGNMTLEQRRWPLVLRWRNEHAVENLMSVTYLRAQSS
jgi:hypothetical protein